MPELDKNITARDLQIMADADGVAAFLAGLGYNTNARIVQSAENLGITADTTARAIRRIELMADQEGDLQVYLFELKSVTLANTRGLAKAFRNRVGNYLLVLTSDYERIDFVLVEKYLPNKGDGPAAFGVQQVGIRPRALSFDRRKPGNVEIRVLRRFTYTESNGFAQYDKLLSAYTIADWSEEHFNNRALFSDYYLLERLPEFPEWREDPKLSYLYFRDLYLNATVKYAGLSAEALRGQLFEPVFKHLGFSWKSVKKAAAGTQAGPDYLLRNASGGEALSAALTYPWGRSLDSKDHKRDKDTPEENPNALVVSLLEQGQAPWAIVTNGKVWRLYSAKTHSRATNYYEIDLEETIAGSGPGASGLGESFRYFWLFFRAAAFRPEATQREGETVELNFLDRLLAESQEYAKELGERLKERVFTQVFPHLAGGFIQYIREREGKGTELGPERLDNIFQGALTLLYRLLFLFYAESRDLLPAKEARGYWEASLSKIKKEIKEQSNDIDGEAEKLISEKYKSGSYELYDRLATLFRVVDEGDSSLNVPVYNGGLFLSSPAPEDGDAAAVNSRFLEEHKIPDRHLSLALDRLARDVDDKKHSLVFVDYKSLGVRQLGSIYEGLLEFKVRIADRKYGVRTNKKAEVYEPFAKLTDSQKKKAEKSSKVISKGEVYLENDKRERKATGSYYTPDHIVEYIVKNAVGPVLEEKFEALRPKLREAQKKRQEFEKKQEALKKAGLKPEPESKAELIGKDLTDELFDVKVLDPAMGSGHFLVQAVDFITDKALDFLNAFPGNPVQAHLEQTRKTILEQMEEQGVSIDPGRLTDVNLLKRHVLKRCIYGVDLNPMAVELAKVSLWLDCFTLGAPLSFLDHHLRCGNSLIGVTVEEVREALKTKSGDQMSLLGSRFAGMMLAVEQMKEIGFLSDITSEQVKESQLKFKKALAILEPYKRILDLYTSQWFGNGSKGKEKEPEALLFLKAIEEDVQEFLEAGNRGVLIKALEKLEPEDREIADTAMRAAAEKRFFHWELEFPEVFYGVREGTVRDVVRPEGAGFDAVIGNPPYDVLAEKELGYDISYELRYFESSNIHISANRGKKNLYKLFICAGYYICKQNGFFSFIVPMPLLGDDQSSEIRRLIIKNASFRFFEVFPQKDNPAKRIFKEAKLATSIFNINKKPGHDKFYVRTHPENTVRNNSPMLIISSSDLFEFDPDNVTIPSCSQKDWNIVTKINKQKRITKMKYFVKSFQGEINETNERKAGTLSSNTLYPIVIRGAHICMYATKEASQGEDIRLNVEKYLNGKGDNTKAFDHKHKRIGFQRKAPQNNYRRLIAAPIETGRFCLEGVSYITDKSSEYDLDFLLALLNSKIIDYYFRLFSTNAQINEYQFRELPIPRVLENKSKVFLSGDLPTDQKDLLALADTMDIPLGGIDLKIVVYIVKLCKIVQYIEGRRNLEKRAERSRLDVKSQPIQNMIDKLLFKCYGLSTDEQKYIEKRLTEML